METRLTKGKNKSLAGVCDGLANYLDVDVTIIRLLFILGALFGLGITILVYIILLILMPDE